MQRRVVLIFCIIFCFTIIVGCDRSENNSKEPNKASKTKEITDMVGRKVTIPTQIDKVYCAVPTAEAMVCTLIPEKMIAWVNEPSDSAKSYLSDEIKNLPAIGGWMGQKVTASIEDIIAQAPDVIIFMTTVTLNSDGDETADQIQSQTGIPVIVMDSSFSKMPDVYRELGEYLGVDERGEKLAKYCEEKMNQISEMVKDIPENEKVRVYYAEGEGGLATDPSGSTHTEVIDYINAINVADVEAKGGQGMSAVSMEQIINWDPELILVSAGNAENYNTITTSDIWSGIEAVKNNKVYLTPSLPFNWFDRPPNIMRILGIQWFGKLIYPDYVDIDIDKEIKEFYKLFYKINLSDENVSNLTNK